MVFDQRPSERAWKASLTRIPVFAEQRFAGKEHQQHGYVCNLAVYKAATEPALHAFDLPPIVP